MDPVRLPSFPHKGRKKKPESKLALYAREGRLEMKADEVDVPPVSLDPDVMNQLVKEIAMKEAQEAMQVLPPSPLPGPAFV